MEESCASAQSAEANKKSTVNVIFFMMIGSPLKKTLLLVQQNVFQFYSLPPLRGRGRERGNVHNMFLLSLIYPRPLPFGADWITAYILSVLASHSLLQLSTLSPALPRHRGRESFMRWREKTSSGKNYTLTASWYMSIYSLALLSQEKSFAMPFLTSMPQARLSL